MTDDQRSTAAHPWLAAPEASAGGAADWTAAVPIVVDQSDADPGPPTGLTPAVLAGHAPPDVMPYDEPVASPGLRNRLAVVYDVDGPRVRLAIGWAVLIAGALAAAPQRRLTLAALYGLTAGWAAFQAVGTWPARRSDQWTAAAAAAAVPVATGAFGVRGTGGALLGMVVVALVADWAPTRDWRHGAGSAARIVTCSAWVGLAGAGVVLTLRYEIGAVITLLVLVSAYEASDYVVGSGASNRVEGPLAGIISIAVVTTIVAFLNVPPFDGTDAFAFGAMAAVLCPVGQLVGSAILPFSAARAPALRRIDSLLLLGPLWAWSVGLLMVHRT